MLRHASRNNLTSSLAWVCVCVWTEGRKKHKRNGEQESYVYPFIADSAVLVKVTAHLLADIQPVCSYTLPSHRNAYGNSTGPLGPSPPYS